MVYSLRDEGPDGLPEAVTFLLAAAADSLALDHEGQTPLQAAEQLASEEVDRELEPDYPEVIRILRQAAAPRA